MEEYKKDSTKTINVIYQEKHGRKSLNCLIQDYFEYINQNHETLTDKPPVQIYVNKIQNRVTFKIKLG